MDPNEKPKLRQLLLIKTKIEGKEYIVAQDQSSRDAQAIILPANLEAFLTLLNGQYTLRDIQVELTRGGGGVIVTVESIQQILDELDAHMLLDSPRYRESAALDQRFWTQLGIRKPWHAGQAYPSEPDELAQTLDAFYKDVDPLSAAEKSVFVRGLLAPHIDINSGGVCYAKAYNRLKGAPRADLYVLLGTAHNFTPGPFSVTRKDYMTPLGVLESDKDFIDRLLDKFDKPWLTEDSAHRTEHSIEFQAVFLSHILGGDSSAKVVPILVGSFAEFIENKMTPYEDKEVKAFVDALKSVVENDGRKVTYIVGGDLAHIGPRYGDPQPVLPMDLDACKKKDGEMLDAAISGADDFFNYVSRENDQRNICGMPPMYTMLKLIEGAKGQALDISHWLDESTRSAVTFAAMAYY